MSTISGDSTQYRRNRRGLPNAQQRDGQVKFRRVSGVQRSHDRPITDALNPLFVHPDVPDYGEQHVVDG